uniref:Superoxide dismutase copper/zinc binding domain-containing protein n=1 Tax=Rhizophagus irregularis (strain DAOM 181602 / DAOM 197198 / MUCL 43194) TaxID=747089 RepID=U9TC78_RHIID
MLPDKRVKINVNIEGLSPGLHGIHIHEYGDMSNGCISAGTHFNPQKKTHGGPLSKQRHVGDLGNIRSKLTGKYSVIGRAIFIHELPDDLRLKQNNPESLISGNAGRRLMCGIIGLTDCFPTPKPFHGKRKNRKRN